LYEESRQIFYNNEYPDKLKEIADHLKWTKPDEEEVKQFLVTEKNFNPEKVDKGLKKTVKHH
jgi:flap endonuclease-1